MRSEQVLHILRLMLAGYDLESAYTRTSRRTATKRWRLVPYRSDRPQTGVPCDKSTAEHVVRVYADALSLINGRYRCTDPAKAAQYVKHVEQVLAERSQARATAYLAAVLHKTPGSNYVRVPAGALGMIPLFADEDSALKHARDCGEERRPSLVARRVPKPLKQWSDK